jgi:dolichol-phosphate mannosyltransferase
MLSEDHSSESTFPIRKDQITIIIPTLNEENAIGQVLDELKCLGYEKIIVVDGHSSDRTVEIVKEKELNTVQQEGGSGKAGGIKTGLRLVKTPYVLIMDGDYTYDPKDIAKMSEIGPMFDEVIGVRDYGENMPLLNKLGDKLITRTFNTLFGKNLSDICSGMYLLKTKVAKEILFESKGFDCEIEVAAHIASTNRKIGQVAIDYRGRLGEKKLKRRDGIKITLTAFRLALRSNPVFVIFGLGTLALIPAIVILAWVGYQYASFGISHFVWGIMAITLGGAGYVSFLLAILAVFIKRTEFRIVERVNQFERELKNEN